MCITTHAVKYGLERRRRASLAGALRDVRLPHGPFVVACENGGLCDAGARLLFEARRFHLVETLDCLAKDRQCFVEAALAGREATEVHARHQRERAMASGIDRASRLLEQLAGLVEPPLVGEDLADVVRRHGDARHITDAFEEATPPLVHVESLLPFALVVGLDPEVVQRRRLPLEKAYLLEERQGQSAEGDRFV